MWEYNTLENKMRVVEVIWMIITMTVPEHKNMHNLMISWRVWWFLTATGLAMLNLWRPLQVSECALNLESFHIMNINIKTMVVKQNVWKISLFRSKSWYLEFMGKSNKSVNGSEKKMKINLKETTSLRSQSCRASLSGIPGWYLFSTTCG